VRPIVRSLAAAATFCLLFLLFAGPAAGAPSLFQVIADAEQLRNAGRFADAVRLLEAHLAGNPDDAAATRLLAQTLYWLKDVTRAREVYERGLQRHPDDSRLRLDYGRMLLETGDRRRARELLAPLRSAPESRAEASGLLGTAAYWDGDFTTAERLFREAIAAGSTDPQVRRSLQDIAIVSAPWFQVAPALLHDDQPLDRGGGHVEAGGFLTPLAPVSVRMEWQRYQIEDATQTVWAGEAELGAYLPAARFDVETAVGLVRRPEPFGSLWTGRVGGGFRLGPGVSVGVGLERSLYLRTEASLDDEVTATTARAQLGVDHPRGWQAEVALARHEYFDDNIVRSAYAWLLVPLVHRGRAGVQAGYAFATSDADALRFVLPERDRRALLLSPSASGLGRYDPYHTPLDQQSHAVLAAVRVSSGRSTVRINGAVGVRAEEDFPFFYVAAGTPTLAIGRRRFTPWSGRLATEFRVSGRVALDLSGEAGRGAFYQWMSARLQLTYRFVPRAPDSVSPR
jgi:hypothetical protein